MSENKMLIPERWVGTVVAYATAANAIVAICLWIIMYKSLSLSEEIYRDTQRPIIAVERVDTQTGIDNNVFHVAPMFTNFGPVAGSIVEMNNSVLVNGATQPELTMPTYPAEVPPGGRFDFSMTFFGTRADNIISGLSTLELVYDVNYVGPAGMQYTFCNRLRFEHTVRRFMNLGCEKDEVTD